MTELLSRNVPYLFDLEDIQPMGIRRTMTSHCRSGKSRLILIVLLVLVAIGVIAVVFRQPSGNGGRTTVDGADLTETMRLLRTTLGQLENIELVDAEEGLRKLIQQFPDDLSLKKNLAIATTLQSRLLAAKVQNPNLSEQVISDARKQFLPASDNAREAIDLLQAATGEDPLPVFLSTQVSLAQASLLPYSIADSEEKKIAFGLVDQLSKHSDWVILLESLLSLVEKVNDDQLTTAAAPVVSKASESLPRNLFVGLRALELAVGNRDSAAVGLLQRIKELVKPLANHATTFAEQLDTTPEKQIEDAIAQVQKEDWDEAFVSTSYINNIYKGSTAYQPDRRLVSPHELDLLDFTLVRRLAGKSVSGDAAEIANVSFDVQEFQPDGMANDSATDVLLFDYDLDDSAELVVNQNGKVTVYKQHQEGWVIHAEATGGDGLSNLLIADLFMVDFSSPDRLKQSIELRPDGEKSQFRRDTYPSVIAFGDAGIRIWQSNPEGQSKEDRMKDPPKPSGMEGVRGVTAAVNVDIDADGDLDFVLGTVSDGVQVWINRGDMTFFPVQQHSQMPSSDSAVVDFAIGDFDRDLDPDVMYVSQDGSTGMLENLLHMQFRSKPLELISSAGGDACIAIADLDGNVSWDVIISDGQSVQALLTETIDIGYTKPVDTVRFDSAARRFVVSDMNNDPWTDLVCWSNNSVSVLSFGPDNQFRSSGDFAADSDINKLAVGDLNDDGLLDLALVTKDGISLATNTTKHAGHFLQVQYRGIDDNATGKVNHYAIGSVVECNFGEYYRAQIITNQTTHFGLGTQQQATTLRAILTNGVTQNVIDPSTDQLIVEEQSLKGSCPYLYAWDGEKFAFVTDCLWAAPLGLQVAPGKVVPDRPWEYLKVDGRYLKDRDGYSDLRITEELWEIAYIDHLELTAIDHPKAVDIYTNEKVGPPSIAKHRVFTFDDQHLYPVRKALDLYGNDVTDTLAKTDDDYVQSFRERYRQGLCEPHWIELDLGDLSLTDSVQLVLTGWIFPTDTSLNIQIAQNPDLASVVHPVLEVPDEDGQWQQVVDFMGFPGGKTKTIVVDVTGKLNVDDPRVRIKTSAEIYWDQASVARNQPQLDTKEHRLTLDSAELGFHGFSAQLPRTNSQPHRYRYEESSAKAKWPPLAGELTSFGDCMDMLQGWDDHMVVMAGGDELRLRFRVPSEPVPEGWTRDFVLHCVGWDKDADLNTLAGQTVGPLPFKAMQAYPPPVIQADQAAKVRQTNRDRLTRRQSFRDFWQPKRDSL